MISWLFFDLGSTLIDESACEKFRFHDLFSQVNDKERKALELRIKEYLNQNLSPYKAVAKEFHLKTISWPGDLEKLYGDTVLVLETLSKKYHLGIIANQSKGVEERLKRYGILNYFKIVVSSAEVGVSKPDEKIYKLALEMADCSSGEAYMIGDRLDNDIEPAIHLGMHTIWIRQGVYANSNPKLLTIQPDRIVSSLKEILNYL